MQGADCDGRPHDCLDRGTASGSFVIGKATSTCVLSHLSQPSTPTRRSSELTTTPAGLTIVWTGAPQTTAGTYPVTATVNDTNYQGTASGSFVIGKATATSVEDHTTEL